MKTSEIISILKANKKVDGYELGIENKDSRELFYVLNHLQINRAVKTSSARMRVYSIDEKGTGSSFIALTAADNKTTFNKKINNAISKAKVAKNKYYPLPKKTDNIIEKKSKNIDLNDVACKIAKAIMKADVYEDGWINSSEIFVTKYEKEFYSSNGIKHITNSFKIEVECIPTWSNKKEEFELYKFYETNSIDYNEITKEVNEILTLAKDRSNAKTINDVSIPDDVLVLVKNDMRDLLVENLVSQLSYRYQYTKENHYNIGDTISNVPFDLTLKPTIKGCANSRKYDENGVTLKSKKIISESKVRAIHGDIKFGYYLNEKNITGIIPLSEINAKGIDYQNKKHLIIEHFSSPQLEESSGYWGGEVRLARYYDGEKYIPLSNFSISGNIYNDIKEINFSKDVITSPSYKGPKYFIFKGISLH